MTDALLLDVWVLARSVGAAMDEAVAPSGLVAREFVMYAMLDELGATTPTDLARRSGVPATTISKMLRRMTERGHLGEMDHPEDARSRLLTLTDEGVAVLEKARDGFAGLAEAVEAGLGDEVRQVEWSLAELAGTLRRLGGEDVPGLGPRPVDAVAHELHYVGRALDRDEEAQVRAFLDFVRARRDPG